LSGDFGPHPSDFILLDVLLYFIKIEIMRVVVSIWSLANIKYTVRVVIIGCHHGSGFVDIESLLSA